MPLIKKITFIIYLLSVIASINSLKARIFRGSDAELGRYSYQALLRVRYTGHTGYCGGSIINKRWILSAAHCFRTTPVNDIEVQVGSILRKDPESQQFFVVERINHEAFSADVPVMNDIALFRLNASITYNFKAQPVVLATRNTRVVDYQNVIFTGFGINQLFTMPDTLKVVVMKAYSYRRCKSIEPNFVQTQICTLPQQGRGPCEGDSGGPLVNENGIQIGIDSHSYGHGVESCGQVPEIYTQVASYRDWIDEKLRQR